MNIFPIDFSVKMFQKFTVMKIKINTIFVE